MTHAHHITHHITLGRAGLTGLLLAGIAGAASGATAGDDALLTVDGLPSLGTFGRHIDMSTQAIVVGASIDFPQLDPASAFAFRDVAGAWTPYELVRETNIPDEAFGSAVAIDDDHIVIGAPARTGTTVDGAAYTFVWDKASTSFVPGDRLTAPTPDARFGSRVAIDDVFAWVLGEDRIVVWQHDGVSWTIDAVIDAPATPAGAVFGVDIAGAGDCLVVAGASASHVYERDDDDWSLVRTFMHGPDAEPTAVRTDGTTIVFGGTPAQVSHRGDTGWSSLTILGANGPSVDVDGDRLVVGRPATNDVVLFVRDGSMSWVSDHVVAPAVVGAAASAGEAVSLHGDRLAIGAPLASIAGPTTGAVFVTCLDGVDDCPADCAPMVNGVSIGNGIVNVDDLFAVLLRVGSSSAACDIAPPGGDGIVDLNDVMVVLDAIGSLCGASS